MRGITYIATSLQAACSVLAYPAGNEHNAELTNAFLPRAASSLQDIATVGYATENGGTTGGKGGKVISVSTFEQLSQAAAGDAPTIIVISGPIRHEGKVISGSNKSFIGKGSQAEMVGNGFFIKGQKNIIIRNLKISKVQAKYGDAIGAQHSKNIWIDHVDVSSDQEHGKDYYDGLIDLTHATDFVTVSNSRIHDHFKASLIGHSDKNEQEDTGHLRVTMHNNLWQNVHSRAPSLRFGTAHIFDNVFENVVDGINVRKGAQALVEANSFLNSTKPLYTVDDTGGAVSKGNDFGLNKAIQFMAGKLASVPYKYSAMSTDQVKAMIQQTAGNTLVFKG